MYCIFNTIFTIKYKKIKYPKEITPGISKKHKKYSKITLKENFIFKINKKRKKERGAG